MFKNITLSVFKRNFSAIPNINNYINKSAVLDESYINYNFYENHILSNSVSITKDLHYISLTKKLTKQDNIYKIDKQIIKKIVPLQTSELTLYVRCQNSDLIKDNLLHLFNNKFQKYDNEYYIGNKNVMIDNIINLIKNEN